MEKYKELKELVGNMEIDIVKFYEKGNDSASVRVRKLLQTVKLLAQEIRKDISSEKKKSKA